MSEMKNIKQNENKMKTKRKKNGQNLRKPYISLRTANEALQQLTTASETVTTAYNS